MLQIVSSLHFHKANDKGFGFLFAIFKKRSTNLSTVAVADRRFAGVFRQMYTPGER